MDEHEERAAVARRAARRGGEVALGAFRGDLAVETKTNPVDLVTEADRAAQVRAVEVIQEAYPDETVVAEEILDGADRPDLPDDGPSWVIDPVDGTHNFVAGMRLWATSVAARIDGETVGSANELPAVEDRYTADAEGARRNGESLTVSEVAAPEAFAVATLVYPDPATRELAAGSCSSVIRRFGDFRRLGSAQATLAMVASGELEAAIAPGRLEPWDSVAGAHLVERAGGTVTDLEGDRWHPGARGLVASNGRAHGTVLEAAVDGSRAR